MCCPFRRTYDWNSLRGSQTIRRSIRGEALIYRSTLPLNIGLVGWARSRVKDAPMSLVQSPRQWASCDTKQSCRLPLDIAISFDLVLLTVSDEVRRYCNCHEADGLAPPGSHANTGGIRCLTRFKCGMSLASIGFEVVRRFVLTVANISKVKGNRRIDQGGSTSGARTIPDVFS